MHNQRELVSRPSLVARLIVAFLSVLPTPLARAEIQNDLIGFSPNHVFESANAGENVDVMSGNVTLTIPLGPRYKLTDTFSYGVTLYYNAKIREYDCDPSAINTPCLGTLAPQTYGLGFTLSPGRIYHHDRDYSNIYRVVLEDGSEHMFCWGQPSSNEYFPAWDTEACGTTIPRRTIDSAHLLVDEYHPSGGSDFEGWRVQTTDGKTYIFGNVVDATSRECTVSRIQTTATRPNSTTPLAWVDFNSSPHTIVDSQGRQISFTNLSGNDIRIDFPTTSPSESLSNSTVASYTLRLTSLTVHNPSDNAPNQTVWLLSKIEYPGLNHSTENYEFSYTRDTETPYGWLLTRKLPTGATTDYYYGIYSTSKNKPYHTAMFFKTLTSEGQTYTWSWNRFSDYVIHHVNDVKPSDATSFSGSNPFQVKALDPFDNLTVYNFRWTFYDTVNSNTDCKQGECKNSWDDGLLDSVLTYAGQDPDSTRLVQRVDYEWDSDRQGAAPDVHMQFQYRHPRAGNRTEWYGDNPQGAPNSANSTPVNSRQTEVTTYSPGNSNSGHTVRTVSSNWLDSVRPRQKDEYIDGALYRSTYTEVAPESGNWDANKFVEVRNASGGLVSRTDRKYSKGTLQCQVVRAGANSQADLGNCASNLVLNTGDIATVNTLDDQTGVVTATATSGGDNLGDSPRSVSMTYTPNALDGTNTGMLKTKNFGFSWNAVDRKVDYNTGLTFETHDTAGNTTRYSWDGLGRLTTIEPTLPEQPTVITYPSVKETHVTQQLSVDNFTESDYLYDDLGRVIETKRRNRDGDFDIQKSEYDAAGRVTRKSEWAPDGTSDSMLKWTVYDYTIFVDPDPPVDTPSRHADPLGRIHGVTTPDDTTPETPTTETIYDGYVTTVKVRDVRSFVGGVDNTVVATTVSTKDALGRLIAVDAPGIGADAQYTYDERDNLVDARLSDPSNASHVQHRYFEYDQTGRLRVSANPENGTVQYLSYDARGNLGSYRDARQNLFVMTYDAADRLLNKTQNGIQIVSNSYDTGSGCTATSCSGRLVDQASYRVDAGASTLVSNLHNAYGAPDSSAACPIGSTGGYAGLNGRLSSQKVTIQPWGAPVVTDFCQDALGMPLLIGYPFVYGSGRTRTVAGSTFVNGYLAEFHDEGHLLQFAKSISYAAGGVPSEIRRGDNERDVTALDVRKRPADIQVIGLQSEYGPPTACDNGEGGGGGGGGGLMVPWESCGDPPMTTTEIVNWDSGAYAYDMAGNVKSIGGEQYYYDPMSRLVHATIPNGTLTHTLDFAYDAFGNMTSQLRSATGTTSSRTYTVDWQTNRLTQRVWTLNGNTTTTPYVFDENGNLTEEGPRANVFDEQGRLRQVVDEEKGPLGTYDYDASGHRVRSVAGGVETYYFRDASGQVLSEYQRKEGASQDTPSWSKDYVGMLGKSFALIKNQIPAAPKRPTVVGSVGTGSVTITWDAVNEPDILGYSVVCVIHKHGASSDQPPTSYNINAPTHTLAATYPSSDTVRYYVIAFDTAGNQSDPSPTLTIYPYANTAPAAPATLTATAGDRKISLTWSGVGNDDLAGYTVKRSTSQNGTYNTLNDSLITGTSFVDNGLGYGSSFLSNGTDYWYQVFAVDSGGLVSAASAKAHATPYDSAPPGKLTQVFAQADPAPHTINVTWKSGLDTDIVSYSVYRNTVNDPSSATLRSTLPAVSGNDSYFFSESATEGMTYFYWVTAHDATHESDKSDPVSVRPRNPTISPPTNLSVVFSVADQGTTSQDGVPGTYDMQDYLSRNGCNVTAEDDDQMQASLHWLGAVADPQEYHIYRKALDESVYTKVGTVAFDPNISMYSFNDNTISKGQYDYFVVSYKTIGNVGEESGGTSLATMIRHMPSNTSVRNITGTDSRNFYSTENHESRFATIQWSRVTEPELVGYNLYRMCNFGSCGFNGTLAAIERNDSHACEPVWIRLNAAPLAPGNRSFQDAELGGLGGCFLYAVRPVGLNGVEGPITKVVEMNLWPSQDNNHELDCAASKSIGDDTVPMPSPGHDVPYMSTDQVLNLNDPSKMKAGVNLKVRGTGSPSGTPPAPVTVTRIIDEKPLEDYSGGNYTTMVRVEWTMPSNPPSDLLGFYVESAGSTDGPWKRLNRSPIAWWERHYTIQGIISSAVEPGCATTDALSCASYRVIAVDNDGNESQPTRSTYPAPDATHCPATPDAPTILTAHTVPGIGGSYHTQIQWTPSPGADGYVVYRMIVFLGRQYFYPTQRVNQPAANPIVYDELGDYGDGTSACYQDYSCFYPIQTDCGTGHLEAFYVTAHKATGGESPRSNIMFWRPDLPGSDGYARQIRPDSLDVPVELLACSVGGGMEWDALADELIAPSPGAGSLPVREVQRKAANEMFTAPMTRLGTIADPPWQVLNLHTDHLGSVRLVTDNATTMPVSRHDYFPFGEEISVIASYNSHKYTGHERDQETGLDYMMARYYEGGLARFISVDPLTSFAANLFSPQRWNRYTYTLDNPLKFLDPNGLDITVAANAHDTFRDGIMHSKEFRSEFVKARDNHDIKNITLIGGQAPTGCDGGGHNKFTTTTKMLNKNKEGKVTSTENSVSGGPDIIGFGKGPEAARSNAGHELAELNATAVVPADEKRTPHQVAVSEQQTMEKQFADPSDDISSEAAEEIMKGTEPGHATTPSTPEKKQP